MGRPTHQLAKAHADYNMSLRLTAAHNAVVAALADERRYLAERDGNPRNELAARRWLLACAALQVAMARLDYVVSEIELSARLGFSLAGGVS